MARMYDETALPGSLPVLFHDIFFTTDLDFRVQRLYTFFSFQLLGPLCTQRMKQNGADSKKSGFANLIQELL